MKDLGAVKQILGIEIHRDEEKCLKDTDEIQYEPL
jgi:hypothetical protein